MEIPDDDDQEVTWMRDVDINADDDGADDEGEIQILYAPVYLRAAYVSPFSVQFHLHGASFFLLHLAVPIRIRPGPGSLWFLAAA